MKAVIVFFDTLNKMFLPNYNQNSKVSAPNFERLGKKTLTFNNSYVGSMPCIPARRELHTGRHNFLHREWGPIEPFDDSMPEILKKNGIYTHLISDHLHYWEDGGCTYHTRYSSWEVIRGQEGDHWKGKVGSIDIPDVVKVPQKQTGGGTSSLWKYDWNNRRYIIEEEDFPQTKVFNLGLEFIDENYEDDNWLLQIETFDPHEPFYAPKRFRDMYDNAYRGSHFDWPRGKVEESKEEIEHVRNQYSALVTMCDEQLGRVLDKFDELDMWKDTMLIVGTDHGFLLSEHEYWGKNQMPYFNEISNTPFFIYDPRYGKKNEERDSIVQMIDWAPTILDFFGIEPTKDMQGKPITPIIKDDEPIRDTALFGVFSGHVNITDTKHTYMRSALPEKKDEIYNYTLMTTFMHERIPTEQLIDISLDDSFSTFCKAK